MKLSPSLLKTLVFALLLPASAHAEHKSLKIGLSQFPPTLNPLFDAMVAKTYVLGFTQRPMTAHDADWKPQCLLCTELPSFENGRAQREGKGIAATYTLRDDAFWGDGTPVTTKDVLFAWSVGKHPKSGIDNAEFFAKDIANITVKDKKTFTIHFAKAQCDFAIISDFYALPAHLEKKIFEADPANYRNKSLYATAPATPGLYWGPYVVRADDNSSTIELARNPSWKGKSPAFDTITIKTVENSASLAANLLSGDIDYVAGELSLPLDAALGIEKRLPAGWKTVYKPGLSFEHIDLNLDIAPFNDRRVRQALLMAANREGLNAALFANKQPVAATDVNPLDTVYTDDVKKYPYDPAAAEKLLDEAGLPRKADGKRFTLIFSTTAGNKSRETVAQALQSDWQKIGVDVKIENQPARVLFGDTMRTRKYKGGAMYAWLSSPRNIPKTTLHSSMIPSEKNNYAGQNFSGYKDKETDETLEKLEVVCTPKENMALWAQLQKRYAEELPALPLYYRADPYMTPPWLLNITPTGHMHPTSLHVEDWSVAK